MIAVKAAAGALVRHSHTNQPLPHVDSEDDPVLIDETEIHWARLLRDGDVVPIKAAAPTKARASSSKGDQA